MRPTSWVAQQIALIVGLNLSGDDFAAFHTGVIDGVEQGPDLTFGMTYDDLDRQRLYDAGTYFGAGIWALNQGERE